MKSPLQLLAPARDVNIAREAILHGADAVYIGGPSHGARVAAANSVEDIASLTRFAHLYGAKVYVTLNTIIYDSELAEVELAAGALYDAGVDALIVQDMSLLRMSLPPVDLHASTQCDIRTPQKAAFLASVGFSQLVVPREFSLAEIKEVREAIPEDVKIEAFVHGALCVSYSGDCQASCLAKGRSANRGECAQMCRLPYTLTDGNGHVVMKDKHLLSLRDLNRVEDIERLADAGVSSFKIEGRLKDASYVKHTVGAYRRAIDEIIRRRPGEYCRDSYGKIELTFNPDLAKAFNRGYTSYFIDGRPAASVRMANLDTPKWVGERVATVVSADSRSIKVHLEKRLNNGDGLGFFSKDGKFAGFRLNRIDGEVIYPAARVTVPRGTVLYRNRDAASDAAMSKPTAMRLIAVDAELSIDGEEVALRLTSEGGVAVAVKAVTSTDVAKTSQKLTRRRVLGKMGDSNFYLRTLTEHVGEDVFIPASALASLRREGVRALEDAIIRTYKRSERRPEDKGANWQSAELSYHDNVANGGASAFYADHGATVRQKALEVNVPTGEKVVMTTRYCLRRELGACLREKNSVSLIAPLHISNASTTYRLDFDCTNCRMRVVAEK